MCVNTSRAPCCPVGLQYASLKHRQSLHTSSLLSSTFAHFSFHQETRNNLHASRKEFSIDSHFEKISRKIFRIHQTYSVHLEIIQDSWKVLLQCDANHDSGPC